MRESHESGIRGGLRRRSTVSPGLILLAAAAACGGRAASPTNVEPAPGVGTERGVVALLVTRTHAECDQREEARCAERDALRHLLFVGVPGSAIPRAMIRNERQALDQHRAFFEELFVQGGYGRYIVRSVAGLDAGRRTRVRSWTVAINHEALRIALEREGIMRKFGY